MCSEDSEREYAGREDSLGLLSAPHAPCQSTLTISLGREGWQTAAQGLCSLSQGTGECRSEGIEAT